MSFIDAIREILNKKIKERASEKERKYFKYVYVSGWLNRNKQWLFIVITSFSTDDHLIYFFYVFFYNTNKLRLQTLENEWNKLHDIIIIPYISNNENIKITYIMLDTN